MIGTTLSHYRIVEELGRGGMGIVYKAEDTKLDRTVAIKILPASALSSEDDKARFYREAKSAAALNHPHIAQIYQIDEAVPEGGSSEEPRPFIAMEFIDGQALDETVKQGPLSLEEAVRIVTQIAQALEVAHEKNIVHRDIKAANVMLTGKGDAKVLDFGLAKTAHSTMLTRMGSTLGTVAYMSPEQARGENVDHRTDLWALGVLMYELIAGRLPFGGDYEQAVTYSILNEDPQPLTAIRTGVPMGLEWIVSKLLAKNADDRYQSAKDLIVDLRTVDLTQEGMARASTVKSMPAAPPAKQKANPLDLSGRLHPAAMVLIILLAALAGWWIGGDSEPDEAPGTLKRFTQTLPIQGPIAVSDMSNDGRFLAVASDDVYIVDLSTGGVGSFDLGGVFVHLDFSPSSDRLLITTATGIDILNIETGSKINVLQSSEGGPRAEWADEESIVYEDTGTVHYRSLSTGASRMVVVRDSLGGQDDLDFPYMLPGTDILVASVQYRDGNDKIGFWDLESGELLNYLDLAGRRVQYAAPGKLVFTLGADLVTMSFDEKSLTQSGAITPLDSQILPEGFAASRENTLVHFGSDIGLIANTRPRKPLIVDQAEGTFLTRSEDVFPAAIYRSAAVSPDGQRVAVVIEEPVEDKILPNTDIWVLDFETGSRRRITSGGISDYPAWNPAGDSLYHIEVRATSSDVVVRAASGQGNSRVLLPSTAPYLGDLDVSPDGRWLVVSGGLPTSWDSWSRMVVMDLSTQPSQIPADVGEPAVNGNPRHYQISPDSRYVAFEDEGGIYVQSLEDAQSPAVEIWPNGKTAPRWAPDGSRLYALDVNGGGFGMDVRLDPVFTTLGNERDYNDSWWAFSLDFFDTMPGENNFLFALPDADSEEDTEIDLDEAGIEASIISNFTSAVGGSR